MMIESEISRSSVSSCRDSSRPGVDDDGRRVVAVLLVNLADQFQAVHVGQAEVEHDAVEAHLVQRGEGLGRGADRRAVHVAVADERDQRLALARDCPRR